MINYTPKVMFFFINFHKNFIRLPLPVARLQAPCSSLCGLACEIRAKPMLPVANGFIAYIYSSFMKQVFYIFFLRMEIAHIP